MSANFVLLAEIKLPHVACSIEIIFQLFLKRFSKFCNVANILKSSKITPTFAICNFDELKNKNKPGTELADTLFFLVPGEKLQRKFPNFTCFISDAVQSAKVG